MSILNLTVLDISKPAKEVIIDKINAANSLQLQHADFVMGLPSVETHASYDTKISFSPTTSSSWYQQLTVYYKRIKLQDVFEVNLKAFTAGTETTLQEILPLINATYGIYLTSNDVEPAEIDFTNPAQLNGPGTVEIVAKPTSPLFQGNKTITINVNNVQGPVIYEDNQTYFTVLRENNIDSVVAFNSLGSKLDTFKFLDGATLHSCDIKQMVHWPNNDIMVIGDFDYSHTDSFNAVTRYQHKLVRMNSRGRLNGVSAASRFGAEYSLRYFPDTARGFVYAIDSSNQIGGNVHGLHRYLEDGTYDSTFNTTALDAAPSLISDLAISEDGSIFITYIDGLNSVVKKLTPTGEDAPESVVTVGLALEAVEIVDMRCSVDGVFLRLKLPTNRTKQNIMRLNGVDLWDPVTSSNEGSWVGIVKISQAMVPDLNFKTFHNDRGPNAIGIANQNKYTPANSLCPVDGFVSFIALTVSPQSGFERPSCLALSVADGRHQGISGHYYDDLHWNMVVGTATNATKEVMVWGTYRPLTQAGFGTVRATLALYSRTGDMPQTVFELDTGITIKNVIAVSEETTSVIP